MTLTETEVAQLSPDQLNEAIASAVYGSGEDCCDQLGGFKCPWWGSVLAL